MIPFVVGTMLAQSLAMAPAPISAAPSPFGVGETIEYVGHYKFLSPGHVTLKVVGVDDVRGAKAWHFSLAMNVAVLMFHSSTALDSWTAIDPFESLKYRKVIDGKTSEFAIFPDSGFYRSSGDTTHHPTPHDPIDDLAFIYFLRTTPLHEHAHYDFSHYYRMDKNPVSIDVLGREMVSLDDGTRRYCWILHPIVDEPNGMFARDHDARLWLTDDGLRLPVQIRSNYSVGAITLRMRRVTLAH
ncbi:MAG TPA: DUF3108 domain-containing protein [Gemmatimonadales bacterium]